MKKFMNYRALALTLMAAFAVCMMTTSLTACSSDDDSSSYTAEDINGSWKWITSYDTNGTQTLEDYFVGEYLYISSPEFESTTSEVGDGTFELTGNKFKATSLNGRIFTATIAISGKKMTMEGTTNDGWQFRYTFEKQ